MSDDLRLKKLPDFHILKRLADRYPQAKINPENVEILLLLGRVASDATHHYRRKFDDKTLTSARFTLLLRLRREPDQALSPSELADYLGVTRATISGLLEGLEKLGQIKRVDCKEDRRSCFIQITSKGLKLIDKVAPPYFSRMSELLTHVKKSDLKIFKKILISIADELKE